MGPSRKEGEDENDRNALDKPTPEETETEWNAESDKDCKLLVWIDEAVVWLNSKETIDGAGASVAEDRRLLA